MTVTDGDSEDSSGSKLSLRVRDSCLPVCRGLKLPPPYIVLEAPPNERGEEERNDSTLTRLTPRLVPPATPDDDLLLFRWPSDEERLGGDMLPKFGMLLRRLAPPGEGWLVGRKRCRT
jgi:hypothetical protein